MDSNHFKLYQFSFSYFTFFIYWCLHLATILVMNLSYLTRSSTIKWLKKRDDNGYHVFFMYIPISHSTTTNNFKFGLVCWFERTWEINHVVEPLFSLQSSLHFLQRWCLFTSPSPPQKSPYFNVYNDTLYFSVAYKCSVTN